ncbi:MAG: hypothetical protein FWH19_05045, partial [Treponema sp.]|nr:hypothetical protein [Treponema sp.]
RLGVLRSIYFVPNTAVLLENYRPVLETVGRQLAADPSLRLHIRAYAAPFHTLPGRHMVSLNRANFCQDYFARQFNIAPGRISYEAFGSERMPEMVTIGQWETYRCVELIVVGN